ncbi:uncharacterized protein METZ01_LOCUS189778 [marine metagenome]|uniref:Uncharacterized protein n=1 Tax=marine metagenome TaxID=408172 RepID=A0A382DFY8_9ZZZZ
MPSSENIKILKLSNGESIIGSIMHECAHRVDVKLPLKMDLISHMTPNGIAESLNLSRWMQPFCEEEKFSVNYEHVILVAEASEGLCKYYAHVLKRIDNIDVKQKVIEEEPSDDEIYDEILDEMVDTDTIH